MSVVSGIMLLTGILDEDEPPMNEVRAWLAERRPHDQLVDVADFAGGRKHPQYVALGGGFNLFDEDEFAAFVMSRDWLAPENLVLCILPEEGPTRVYRPKGYELESLRE